MNIHEWVLHRFPAERHNDRRFIGFLEAWVSIIGNIILFIFKFFAGLALNSIALIADAFHSLSDVLTSVVVLVGFFFGSKPADKDHPHGHGRAEYIATLIIAFMLFFVAYEMGKGSINRILHPEPVTFNLIIVILLFLSAAFKEWMASFSTYLGKKIGSSTLFADAWHHRSDAIATLLVAIGLIMSPLGIFWLDGVLGLGVTGLLIWVAWDLCRNSINDLLGKAADPQVVERIRTEACSQPGVLSCHDISVHDYQTHAEVSLHIVVEELMSTVDAHKIAHTVENNLKQSLGLQYVITVHVDPRGEPDD